MTVRMNHILVVPHRDNLRWLPCHGWRFLCGYCRGPSIACVNTAGEAGDWARIHLFAVHGVRPKVDAQHHPERGAA